jgi:hypothetical protein
MNEVVEKVNYVSKFNRLVEEAKALGMTGVKPVSSHFRDNATGERRVAALESSIQAWKEGQAAADRQPGPEVQPVTTANEEDNDMSTVRKTKAAKKAKKAASGNSRKRVTGKTEKVVRDGIVGDFETRKGTHKEALLLALYEHKNKPVPVSDLLKAVYGSKDEENRVALMGGVVVGLEIAVAKKPGAKGWKIVREGRGDEATVALVAK